MCRKVSIHLAVAALAAFASAPTLLGQAAMQWRRIGNAALNLGLPGLASGPVSRVWYSPDARQLYARTAEGQTFVTEDLEQWTLAANPPDPPAEPPARAQTRPEAAVKLREAVSGSKLYALGNAAYRSDDGGASWSNLTDFRGAALLGPGLSDLAVSPRDSEELVVAGTTGDLALAGRRPFLDRFESVSDQSSGQTHIDSAEWGQRFANRLGDSQPA